MVKVVVVVVLVMAAVVGQRGRLGKKENAIEKILVE
jgi:hypothetical protein